jgi:hypothetical protein
MQKRAGFGKIENEPWFRYAVKKDYVILNIILLLAATLRLAGLNEPGLWLDELSYTLAAQKPILTQIINPTETLGDYLSVDPTLSAIPFSLSLKLGYSNFLARFPAAIFAILSIALIYQLGRTLFGNTVGLLAAGLLSISSFHVLYSHESRSYTQFVFFSLASFLFLYKAATHKKPGHWLFYGIWTWAGVSTNHLMIFAVAAQAFFLTIFCLQTIAQQKRRVAVIKEQLNMFKYFCLSLLSVFILRTPWLEDFTHRQCAGCAIGQPSYPLDLKDSFIQSVQAFIGSNNSTVVIVFLTLFIASLALSLPLFPKQSIFLLSWSGLSILITVSGLWFISQFFHPRYTIWGLPAFLLIIACGFVRLGNLIQKALKVNRLEAIPGSGIQPARVIFISLLLAPVLLVNLHQIQHHANFKQSWPRGMLQEATELIVAEANPYEAVVAIGLPARHLQFYVEQNRQDLVYLDDRSFVEQHGQMLPSEFRGRWYVIHNSYTAPNIPKNWLTTLQFYEFDDIIVVYLPAPCQLRVCIEDTKMLLSEISQANPGSDLETTVGQIIAGLTQLNY